MACLKERASVWVVDRAPVDRIGGYQVCDKWLKDRKDRRLELDDIRTYCRVVTAIERTLAIQKEVDIVYADVENNLMTILTE